MALRNRRLAGVTGLHFIVVSFGSLLLLTASRREISTTKSAFTDLNVERAINCFETPSECSGTFDLYAHNPDAEVAQCITGDVRTLCRPHVHKSIHLNLLEGRKNDVFLVVGTRQKANCTRDMWRSAFESLAPVAIKFSSHGPFEKHQECFLLAQERARNMGSPYRWLTRVRPDLLIESRISSDVFTPTEMVHLYDIIAVCPFALLNKDSPCFPPNNRHDNVGDMRTHFDEENRFSLSFERIDNDVSVLERHFAWAEYYMQSLALFATSLTDEYRSNRVRACFMQFLATVCYKYHWYGFTSFQALDVLEQTLEDILEELSAPYGDVAHHFEKLGQKYRTIVRGLGAYAGYKSEKSIGDMQILAEQCSVCTSRYKNRTLVRRLESLGVDPRLLCRLPQRKRVQRLLDYHPPEARILFRVENLHEGMC